MIFEKIRERLNELYDINDKFKKEAYEEQDWERFDINSYRNEGVYRAIDIINQVEDEYNNGWIPCSERLPEEAFGCLVTVMDYNPMTGNEFENILPYHVGFDGETWNDSDGKIIPFDVIAWQPLPNTPKGE